MISLPAHHLYSYSSVRGSVVGSLRRPHGQHSVVPRERRSQKACQEVERVIRRQSPHITAVFLDIPKSPWQKSLEEAPAPPVRRTTSAAKKLRWQEEENESPVA